MTRRATTIKAHARHLGRAAARTFDVVDAARSAWLDTLRTADAGVLAELLTADEVDGCHHDDAEDLFVSAFVSEVCDKLQRSYPKACACGRVYSEQQFRALPCPAGGGAGAGMLWRNCDCGSTLAVEVGDEVCRAVA